MHKFMENCNWVKDREEEIHDAMKSSMRGMSGIEGELGHGLCREAVIGLSSEE